MAKGRKNLGKHGMIAILLWVFAPAAWYLMWKDKQYHSWFPHLLWINGVVFSVVTLFFAIRVHIVSLTGLTIVSLIVAFAAMQIVGGLILSSHVKKNKQIDSGLIIPIIIIFIVDLILGYLYVFL